MRHSIYHCLPAFVARLDPYNRDLSPEVLIVGSGVIGLATGRELARAGLRVKVLERGRKAAEASWAAAGMLSPSLESFPSDTWRERARNAFRAYPGWIADLERDSGVTIDFRLCPAHVRTAGTWTIEAEGNAVVDPREVCAALASGLDVEEGVDVRDLGALDAAAIVVATGAWAFPGLPEAFPIRGHMLAYEMEPGSLVPILREGHTYIFQRRSGLTLVGSTEQRVGFDRSLDRDALADLERRGAELLPELAGRRPADVWCGFRPATPTGLPVVERIANSNVWAAYGHYRNGILLAPDTARQVAADVIASLETD